ncbi:hypothetical protein MJ565_10735 [Klebsiella pneumoniae]|nr:hypothetical protein MJ565_10735 [Klebsiella pneumoniae]
MTASARWRKWRAINLQLPAHEFPTDQTAIELFRSQWRDRFEAKRDAEHIYQQVSKVTLPAGIEYWQPLFFSEPLPPLFSYFPAASTLIVNTGDLGASAERFQNERLAPALKTAASTRCARSCRLSCCSGGCAEAMSHSAN